MIKIGILPATLVMTIVTFFPELATVPLFLVILLMASHALGGQLLLIQQSFLRQVAGIALGLAMLALEGISGVLIMKEFNLLPTLVVVAGLAFIPIASFVPLVLVNCLVTAMTG